MPKIAAAPKQTVVCNLNIAFRHLQALSKLLKGVQIIPHIDLSSHMDVYIVLCLAEFLGVDDLDTGFTSWTAHRKWIELFNPEYLYLIYNKNEMLVDFKQFFRVHRQVIESIRKAIHLPESRKDPEMFIEMLLFFKNYDFALCFDTNNSTVQARIDLLTKGRATLWEDFMVNPYADFMAEFFTFRETNHSVWDCKGISAIEIPQPGESVLVPYDEFRERVEQFTHGKLKTPMNPTIDRPFPLANVAFAGGAITKLLAAKYDPKNARQSDVDLFIHANSFPERARVFEEIINWFSTFNVGVEVKTYYAMCGCVTTIYIKNLARKFQIITNNGMNPFEVISRFDLTHIQWCMMNGQVFGTPEACVALRERVTRFNNTHRLRIERLVKALHCGYSILKDNNVIENYVDITGLIEDPESVQLKKMIREFHGWYYPQTSDMDFDDELQHILCMIEKDAKATLSTIDPKVVLNNVTIGGNFENDYESMAFSTFNPGVIVNHVVGRRIRKVLLHSKLGTIRLTTPIFKVSKVTLSEAGIEIRVSMQDDAFREFCNVLEGQVFRLFQNGGVTRHIISESNECAFFLPRMRLDMQTARGVSCMRSQRGAALNVEEDMRIGDDIQVLFIIEIVKFDNERAVDLKPVKFVKYQKYDPETAALVQAVNDDIEKEIERLANDTEFVGEIQYEDNVL
jgi:hypothetical protein